MAHKKLPLVVVVFDFISDRVLEVHKPCTLRDAVRVGAHACGEVKARKDDITRGWAFLTYCGCGGDVRVGDKLEFGQFGEESLVGHTNCVARAAKAA